MLVRLALLVVLCRSPREERCFILKMMTKLVLLYLVVICSSVPFPLAAPHASALCLRSEAHSLFFGSSERRTGCGSADWDEEFGSPCPRSLAVSREQGFVGLGISTHV